MLDKLQTPSFKAFPEGLVDNNPGLTKVVLPNDFETRIGTLLDTPMPKPYALQSIVPEAPYSSSHSLGSQLQGLFQKSQEDLKRKDPNFNNPLRAVHSYNMA